MEVNSNITSFPAFSLDIAPQPFDSVEANLRQLESYIEKLYLSYNESLVNSTLKALPREYIHGEKPIPQNLMLSIELYCAFAHDMDELSYETDFASKAAGRIFNHFIRRVLYKLSKVTLGIDANSIQRCLDNVNQFKAYCERFLQDFNEEIAHKMLIRHEVFSPEVLVGKTPLSSYEDLAIAIEKSFAQEEHIRQTIEKSSVENLKMNLTELKGMIRSVTDYRIQDDLIQQLALKCGIISWLRPIVPAAHIKKQADLFEASRKGGAWARNQAHHLQPYGSSKNTIYFLYDEDKGMNPDNPPLPPFPSSRSFLQSNSLKYFMKIN